MTFVALSNLVLAILCVAVVVQSVRMIQKFNALKSSDLGETVKSLDRATAQARQVLAELKQILETDGAASIRTIQSGENLREELTVMVGIGNAVAERILEAASNAGDHRDDEMIDDEPAPAPVAEAAPRQRRAARPARAKAADPANDGEFLQQAAE